MNTRHYSYIALTVLVALKHAFAAEPMQDAPAKPICTVSLFYQFDTLQPGRANEFVVKVHNNGTEPLKFSSGQIDTNVVGSEFRKLKPVGRWYLQLVVDPGENPGIMDLSGRVSEAVMYAVAANADVFVSFTPPDNRLPGKKPRLRAELVDPAGNVYRSNEIQLRR